MVVRVSHLTNQNEVGGGHSRAILLVAPAATKGGGKDGGCATLEIAHAIPTFPQPRRQRCPSSFPPQTNHQLPASLPAHAQQLSQGDTMYLSNSSCTADLTAVHGSPYTARAHVMPSLTCGEWPHSWFARLRCLESAARSLLCLHRRAPSRSRDDSPQIIGRPIDSNQRTCRSRSTDTLIAGRSAYPFQP